MTEAQTTSGNNTGNMVLYPWWILLILGIVVLILGLSFLSWPYLTLMLVVTFVGAYWFVSGIFSLISLIIDRSNMGWKLLIGIMGIIAGIVIMTYPLFSTVLLPAMLVIFVGVWGLLIGAVHLAQAFGTKDWGSGLLGVLAIIFGILLLANPFIAVAMLPFIFGGFGVVGGIIAIIMSFQFRKMVRE